MMTLEKFFEDLFDDKNISFGRLRLGADFHIGRIVSNNSGGLFTALLVETESAYNGYFGGITDIDLKMLVQKSKTSAKNNLEITFSTEVKKLYKTVDYIFIDNAIVRAEFFSNGLGEYTETNDTNRPILMERLRFLTDKYKVELGQPTADLFAAIKTNYGVAVDQQAEKIGAVATVRTDRHVSRKILTVQLTRNAHFVGYNFSGNVDRCMDFFDQSKFFPKKKGQQVDSFLVQVSENEGDVKEIVPPTGFSGSPTSQLIIDITTPIPAGKKLMIFFGLLPTDMPTLNVIVTESDEQTVTFASVGYATGKKIFGRNIGTGAIDFEVEFVA